VKSVEAETALSIRKFVKEGGKLVVVDGYPRRSLSFSNSVENDRIVNEVFEELSGDYSSSVIELPGPENPDKLLSWSIGMLKRSGIEPDVEITVPDKDLFQIRQTDGDRDIWFFVNSHRANPVRTEVKFPTGSKVPWIWDPESGIRKPFIFKGSQDQLTIELDPLQSLLLVFEKDGKEEEHPAEISPETDTGMTIEGPWMAWFNHMNGTSFGRSFEMLDEFGTSDDMELNSFAGTVSFETTFESDGNGKYLLLNKVNRGVTSVFLNNKEAGTSWYGKPQFRIDSLIRKGENTLRIVYTSVLSNYVSSLKDNPAAARWTKGYNKIPMGPEGPVTILGSKAER